MSISKKDVEHIAKLARIEIGEKEKERFAVELSSILGFVEKLNEADTADIKPAAGGTLLENEMRPDEAVDAALDGKQVEILAAVPERKDSWVKVRSVFE